MIIGSISENRKIEKRIAITPEIVKKYSAMGCKVSLIENYGSHLGIDDKEYLELGAKFYSDEKEILSSSDIVVQLGMLSDEKSLLLKENQISRLIKPSMSGREARISFDSLHS